MFHSEKGLFMSNTERIKDMCKESITECFKWKYDDFVRNMED